LISSLAKHQRGLTSVEFAIIGALFFTVLIGIIEVGRLLFTWNTLHEVTRRAARLAAVCPVGETAQVQNTATFNGTIINGLDPADVIISYLDGDGSTIAPPITNANFGNIMFVQARIANTFQYQFLVPFYTQWLTPPEFRTTMVAESLGISPVGTGITAC
jgi:hypothetical protein